MNSEENKSRKEVVFQLLCEIQIALDEVRGEFLEEYEGTEHEEEISRTIERCSEEIIEVFSEELLRNTFNWEKGFGALEDTDIPEQMKEERERQRGRDDE